MIAVTWIVGFCLWFHSYGLPNNPGVQRWMLWTMVPFDLFDIVDPPVVAKAAPWSWLFLFQRVPFALIALGIWVGAWGMGALVLRWLKANLSGLERHFFSFCLGISIVSLITLFLGVCACLNRWVMLIALITCPLVELSRIVNPSAKSFMRTSWNQLSRYEGLMLFGISAFVAVELLGSMSPQVDFDVVEYHLGGPKEWFQQGHIARLPHNVYTNFPFLSEMVILTGMVLYGDWEWGALAGQAATGGFIPLTALGLLAAGRRWFSFETGLMAALIYVTSPWTYRITIIAYAEGSLACYLFASFYAALLFRENIVVGGDLSTSRALSILTGLMSGSAMSCKYTGLISVIIPTGLLLVWAIVCDRRDDCLRRMVLYGSLFLLGVMAAVGPWLVKNALATGNPVYPLGVPVFGGIDRDPEIDEKWRHGHAARHYESWSERLRDLPVKCMDVAANNDWHSPLMFGFAPLSLFFLMRRRESGALSQKASCQRSIVAMAWVSIAWQFATWWLLTHHIDRFYVPMFSLVALLAGAGVSWPIARVDHSIGCRKRTVWQWTSGFIIMASMLFNADVMLHLGGFHAGRLDLKAARDIATPGRIRWLNEELESGRLPPETKVLCVGEAQMFHARYAYLYNTVFDRCVFEQLCAEPGSDDRRLRPVADIRADFHRLGITHIDVNWAEIGRYRAPGSYGYTDFVQPERFEELQRLGLIGPSLFTTTNEGKPVTMTGQIFPVLP